MTCDGTCCKRLWLVGNPDELYEKIMRNGSGNSEIHEQNIWFWLQLRSIGLMRGVEWGVNMETPSYRYYCTRLDWKTGKCTVYENRPYICRDHAERFGPCKYVGCKHDNAVKFLEYMPGTATHVPEDVTNRFESVYHEFQARVTEWIRAPR